MRTLLVVFILYGTISLWAQVQSFLSVDFQNDFLDCRGHGTDRFYTAGNFLNFTRVYTTKKQVLSLSLIQQAFTPSDLQDTIVSNFDYPYAGLLFLEGSYGWTYADSSLYIVTTASLGQTGKYSGVAGLQRALHRVFRDEMPKGWSSMDEQGAIVQTSIGLYKTHLFQQKKRFDFYSQWKWGSIYNNVRLGIYGSIGYVPPFSIRSMVTPASFSNRPIDNKLIDRFSFYVSPSVTWVFSNRLLDKSGFLLSRNVASISPAGGLRSRVVSMEGGLAYNGSAISIIYRQNWQSAELYHSKSHHYGSISIIYNLSYKSK
jgi:hypothetical protein